jgi:pyruvate/2-oxoglutarate/acetoin dehydrogenase E1 component
LCADNIDVEVVDLRSLTPLDLETVLESTRRTGRLVIAHEAVERGGVGAEIAAEVQREIFEHLEAPVARVASPFSPVPASPDLEKSWVPGEDKIAAAIAQMVGRKCSAAT